MQIILDSNLDISNVRSRPERRPSIERGHEKVLAKRP